MNNFQKGIAAAGAVLAALRVAFPVKQSGFGGLKFDWDSGFSAKTDWQTTGLHIALIAAVTAVIIFLSKKK